MKRFRLYYRMARWIWRRAHDVWWSLLRILVPKKSSFGPSKGSFSALELLRHGQLEGRLVSNAQARPHRGPQPLRTLAGILQDQLGSWPVFWTRHRNTRLVGETLVVQDEEKRICFEAAYGKYGFRRDRAFNYFALPTPVKLTGNWTSVISQWSNGYYHWFMD